MSNLFEEFSENKFDATLGVFTHKLLRCCVKAPVSIQQTGSTIKVTFTDGSCQFFLEDGLRDLTALPDSVFAQAISIYASNESVTADGSVLQSGNTD